MTTNTPRMDALERNLFINGNLDIWQRTTNVTVTFNTDFQAADRWWVDAWGGATYSVGYTRSTDVPTLAQSGFQSSYSLLLTNNNVNGNNTTIHYAMEGYDYQPIHGKKVRVQFWAKTSVAGTYSLAFENGGASRSYVTTFTFGAINTWEKKTFDLQMDTVNTGWTFDNTLGVRVWIGIGAQAQNTATLNTWLAGQFRTATANSSTWGTTNGATFQVAQLSLIPQDLVTAGSTLVDIPFQRAGRSIGHELAMCQRYYEKTYDAESPPGTVTGIGERVWMNLGTASNTSFVSSDIFKVTKRGTPTITFYNGTSGASGNWESLRSNAGSVTSDSNVTMTAANQGHQGFGGQITGSFTVSQGDAVVFYGHWTADSELS